MSDEQVASRVAPHDFKQIIQGWEKSYEPISARDMEMWLEDFVAALRKLPYQSAVRPLPIYSLDRLFAVRCRMNLKVGNFDMVFADLERLWGRELTRGMLSAPYAREDEEGGFEFLFATLQRNHCYLTGAISIHKAIDG